MAARPVRTARTNFRWGSQNGRFEDVRPAVSNRETKKEMQMWLNNTTPKIQQHARLSLLVAGVLLLSATPGFSRDKYETLEAQAFGTGTQTGRNIGVSLQIYEFSTPADKQILVQAYEKGQNQGLVSALQKMKAVGRVEVTGTLGTDCAYIKMIHTPTGRKIFFITNRWIRFGEAYYD